jgi:hypothetical protein
MLTTRCGEEIDNRDQQFPKNLTTKAQRGGAAV